MFNIKQKLPFIPVIPIVLYHGVKQWRQGKLKSCFKKLPEAFIPFIPDFNYIFINLSNYSNEEIKETIFKVVSLKISLLILKNIFNPEILETALAIESLRLILLSCLLTLLILNLSSNVIFQQPFKMPVKRIKINIFNLAMLQRRA